MRTQPPAASGLYDPRFEHDACGVSFVVDIKGRAEPRHRERRRSARSATSTTAARRAPRPTPATAPASCCRSPTASCAPSSASPLPPAGAYGVGLAFLPVDPRRPTRRRPRVERDRRRRGAAGPRLARPCPIDASTIGATALSVMPSFRQLFVDDPRGADGHRARPQAVRRPQAHASTRSRGRASGLLPVAVVPHPRLQGDAHHAAARRVLPRPADERVESALALVHSRFSTNTFPSWPLAHPYRYLAHNGEINTVQGNRNWMRAREALHETPTASRRPRARVPDLTPGASDTASFDECLELLHLGGRPICARRADDDPGGVGEPRHDGRRRSAPSTGSTPR